MDKKPKLPRYAVRLEREAAGYKVRELNSPDSAGEFLKFLGDYPEERFAVVFLDARLRPRGYQEISVGTVSASLVHPREVFKGALLSNCDSIIVAHNHPSGDPTPSQEDIEVTSVLIGAGKILKIRVMDHIVIGDHNFSLRQQRPELWD